jgi:thiol:disulfide interchange protein DsbC
VFLYPFLGEDSILMSERILASADPGKAFLDWMLRGIEPKKVNVPEDVKQILRQNIGLALSLNIMGTPAIYTEDGAGPLAFMTAKELQRHLDAVKK